MAALKTLILEVDESKAASLTEALAKRDYIHVVRADRTERKMRKTCPWCGQRFPREITYAITESIAERMLRVVKKMAVAKSVIIMNKKTTNTFPDYEKPRVVPFDHNEVKKAELLGLLQPFEDGGSRTTYFATAKALALLSGKEEVSPAWVTICQGKIIETGGEISLDKVKFKDLVYQDRFAAEAKKAVAKLPKSVIEFVKKGQMSLLG